MTRSKVHGHVATGFEPVAEAFDRNLRDNGELGAAVAIYHKNKLVADLWGGLSDAQTGEPWSRDTIVMMMSVSKGIVATCMAMLVDRGDLELEKTVAQYWPEFAAAGKQNVTVRQALSHLACIPVTDHARPGDVYNWDRMVEAIALQGPLWPVATVQEYHSSTLGFIAGELLRRTTGETVGSFVRKNIQEPLEADFFFGLSQEEQRRCAKIVPSRNNVLNAAKLQPTDSIAYRMWQSIPVEEDYNSIQWRTNEIPSVNGHGSARAVASIYNCLSAGVKAGAAPLVSAGVLEQFVTEQRPTDQNAPPGRLRMGVGFMLNTPPHRAIGPNMSAFGHSGTGGSQGFADPEAELSLCYATNKLHDGTDTGIRATSIIDSAYASLK